MSPPALSLEQIFADHLRVLATTLRPNTRPKSPRSSG